MKFNYINICLFSLSLNILLLSSKVYNQRNHNLTHHKPTITSRMLWECEMYAPGNYDNDPEMKEVIQDFDRQTSQRFEEYNEHMIKNKQKCKEQCDKDIQKIILKDKIEKELTEKFAALNTIITTKDIPTCVCEKSVADKTEKFCHNCRYRLGSIVPSVGLLGGPGNYGWKIASLATAKELAEKGGAVAGEAVRIKAGIDAVIEEIKSTFSIDKIGISELEFVFDEGNYTKVSFIKRIVYTQYQNLCESPGSGTGEPICNMVTSMGLSEGNVQAQVSPYASIQKAAESIVLEVESIAEMAAEKAIDETTIALTAKNTGAVNATYASSQIAIIASVVAIFIIVLVMVIIYLILRYRKKKKMIKKFQYIKLLKE